MNNFIKSCAISRCVRAAIAVAITAAMASPGLTAPVVSTALASAAASTNLTACTCLREVILRVSDLPIKPVPHKPLLDQRTPLLNTLAQAGRQIALCNTNKAGGRMVQFVNQIQGLVRKGSLDQATANSLAVCAKTIGLCGVECPPVALAKRLVVTADSQCQADPPAAQFDNGSFDPDGIIVSRFVTPPGPYPLGETLVTYTVVDNRGAFSSVSTSVLVKDTTGPSVNFPPYVLVFVPPGQSSGAAIFPEPEVSDSCSGVASVSFAPPSGALFPLGVTPAALIVVDGMGNTNQISFNVVVLPNAGGGGSNLPPVAIAHAVTNAADANCEAVVTADQVDNHSFDPDGTIVNRIVEPAGPFPVGSVTPVTLTVVDNQGAASSVATTVTVLNRTPPAFLTPLLDITVTPAPGQKSVVVNYPTLSVTDTCSAVSSVGVSYTPPSGTVFGFGTNTATCTVFDGAGNTNTTTFRVIVKAFDVSVCATIPGLIQQVQAIPLTAHFNSGRQSSMVQKLDQAQLDVTLNKLTSATALLDGFISSCSIYQNLGVLDFATASELISCATNIQTHL